MYGGNLANTEHSAYIAHMQQRLKEHFGNKIIQTEIKLMGNKKS